MEKKRGKSKVFAMIAMAIALIAIVHTSYHFYTYGFGKTSGFAAADTNLTNQSSPQQKISFFFIAAEWLIFGAVLVGSRNHKSRGSIKEIKSLVLSKKNSSSHSKTDLDILYDLLKEKKELDISEIAAAFDVTKEVAFEWCKMLEESNLAEIEYSSMGKATIKIPD
jgi:hypothetical protein